jgi:single-stranded-DNA-specific exonuclease
VRLIKADVVGTDHVRLIAAGDDGGRLKAVAFRQAGTALGQALLGAGQRRLWLAGRARLDDWQDRRTAELHVEDAAWAD